MRRLSSIALILALLLLLVSAGDRATARPNDGHLEGSGYWADLPATGRSWYGAHRLGGATAYCADLMSASPRLASAWTEAPIGAPVPKQTGLATGSPLRFGAGSSALNERELAEIGWVLTITGPSPSPATGAAVEHFVRLRTIDGTEQRAREAARWGAVTDLDRSAGVEFDRLTREAARYAGPYTMTLTWSRRPTLADPTGRLMVEVRSGAGHSLPNVELTAAATGGMRVVEADETTGAGGLAHIDVSLASPTADPTTGAISATASGLPGTAPRVFLPREATVQRLLVAPATTSLTATRDDTLEPHFSPIVTTQTRDVVAEAGAPAVDVVTIRGGRPGAAFSGTTTLYGPFPSLDALRTSLPADRPIVGTATFEGTYGPTGSQRVESTALTFPGPGFYTWVEDLAPAEYTVAPPAPSWPQLAETSIVLSPSLSTTLDPAHAADSGVEVSDTVMVGGLPSRVAPDGSHIDVSVSGRLAGPVAPVSDGKGGATCQGVDWAAAPTVASYEDVPLPLESLSGLAPATLLAPGCYSAEATMTVTHESRAPWIVGHPLGHPDQTILITEPPAPPSPTPSLTPPPTISIVPAPSPTPSARVPAVSTRPGLPSTGDA